MLPPGSDITAAVKLGSVDRIITDPENVDAAVVTGRPVLVLGGGDARGLEVDPSHDVIDLEQIDPTKVNLPGWYRPDPGVARELAFIIFAESGGVLEAKQITNYRWALSAFGTATAADLDRGDTVYCLAPLHHSSSLLATIGGAMAGGSRIALSRGLNPARFVEEIHRYGVTVVSYTWSMVREILDEDLLLIDGSHPVRLFIGSGMPPWSVEADNGGVRPRAGTRVLCVDRSDVILANVAGSKVGSKGAPAAG